MNSSRSLWKGKRPRDFQGLRVDKRYRVASLVANSDEGPMLAFGPRRNETGRAETMQAKDIAELVAQAMGGPAA